MEEWIWISEDITLREVLSQRFEGDLFQRKEDFSKIASIELESIDSEIQSGTSVLYSLATLTMGTFEIVESEYNFSVRYLDGVKVEKKNFRSKTRMTLRAPMPPYIGLGTTASLILLDRYKTPEHLSRYCNTKEISITRALLESNKEEYCHEYKKNLLVAWIGVESQIERDLMKRRRRR